MRLPVFARWALIVLAGLALPARAVEIEQEMRFAGTGGEELRIISTTDIDLFQPLILGFQALRPELTIQYAQASSTAVFQAVTGGDEAYDLAISSAMDLQTKAANDGFVRSYSSAVTAQFPDWSHWRRQVIGFSQEPAVLVAARGAFDGLTMPRTRAELIEVLRSNPERFAGRIATYDVRESGLGYLFATQDARQSDGYWRLTEVMGALRPRLYCCSSLMIRAIEEGEILLAYNVLGSYAQRRLQSSERGMIVPMADYTNVMIRSILIPKRAPNPAAAGQFIDFLLSPEGRAILQRDVGLPPLVPDQPVTDYSLRPIRFGPGLLVYLDQLKRKRFIDEWQGSLIQ